MPPRTQACRFSIMPFRYGLEKKGEARSPIGTQCDDEAYSLLSTAPLSDTDFSDNVRLSSLRPTTACNVLTVLFCFACVAINWSISIAQTSSPANLSGVDVRSISRNQYHTLRRPSPFIGFDRISRASPPIPRSLLNYPVAIALVNSSHPDQIFSDDPMQHMTATGTVSPEVRPVILTNNVCMY